MKKILLLLLLISISGYSQTLLKLKAIEYAPAAGYCIITNSLGVQTYTPCSSLSSTVIPTLQQVVTKNDTIDGILATSLDGSSNISVSNSQILNQVTDVGGEYSLVLNSGMVELRSTDAAIPVNLSATSVTKNGVEIATTINYYNVKDYGATGDGTTDDYTSINDAITASIAGTGAVNLIFPYGTYKVGTQLSVDNSTITVNIIGNGSTLKSNISTASTAVLFIQSAKTINIDRLKFDLNSLTTSNHRGLRIGDYTNNKYCGVARITNCDFTGFGQESQLGIWVQNTPYISGLAGNQNLPSLLIDGCNFYNQNTTATVNYTTMTNYGVGLRIGEQTDYAKVSNCNFNYIRIGVWSEAAANLDLTNCNFLACFPKQSSVYTYGALYVPNSGSNNGKINVVACKFNHNYGYSIYYAYATTERPLTVSSCHFIANATTAIYMTHTSTISTQSLIQCNYFERCSQAYTNSWTAQPFGSTLQPFIYLNNELNVAVKNNKFLNDASYAVISAGSSDYTTAQLNHISNTTGTYSLTGSNNILETGSDKLVYSLSPALTGTPTAPTAAASSSNTTIANTEYVDRAVAAVPGGGDLLAANNLSDVTNTVTARNNILPTKTGNSLKILRVNAGETDYELFASGAGTGDLISTNNLSDVANSITSLGNLGVQTLYLTADQTNTASATPAATTLSFTATANKKYAIGGYLHIGCNNTGGVKIQITLPSGATMNVSTFGFTTGATAVAFGTITNSATLGTAYCTLNSVGGQLKIDGTIEIAGTGGTVSIEFAPTTNTQTATVYKLGTNVLVRKLD